MTISFDIVLFNILLIFFFMISSDKPTVSDVVLYLAS